MVSFRIERGIPAIAFSSGNTILTPYFWVNATTKAGLQDPATITARLASSLVQALIFKANGAPVLPKGYGMTVNLPYITSYASDKCTNPPFVLSRMAQNASVKVSYSSKTGLFGLSAEANGLCLDGDCSLPIEKDVLNSHCMSSVTPFSVEYISTSYHGECFNTTDVTALVPIVVQTNVSTTPGGGLGVNVTIVGNVSVTPSVSVPPPAITAITGMGVQAQWPANALVLCLGVAAFMLFMM
ncbi:hypothetical protein B0H67DRAFT_598571 [Lasiosphaeris hirsuta]|uniref:Uncharacterized protein n=1 Tax=Lasiosphaeris hirsuta TaxID=260670 RepID=A0AA40E7H1_9PEZI|nr:hypothetical protein B0H67DRAFT_598571 [Lasiosphaeris hirsuta]